MRYMVEHLTTILGSANRVLEAPLSSPSSICRHCQVSPVLLTVSITVKSLQDHSNCYKGKHLAVVAAYSSEVQSTTPVYMPLTPNKM